MKEKIELFIIGIILVLLIFETEAYPSFGTGQQNFHRIRHYRHAIRSLINSIEQEGYNHKCAVKSWDSPNILRKDCPPKLCKYHQDCWVPLGPPRLCTCDPHLCGLVCMEDNQKCPEPVQPVNGHANYTALWVGDQVEYTCSPGYAVKGPRKRYCQANLKLSGSDPECTDQTDLCFSAPYIPNAQVADGSYRDDYKNNEKVNIICQKGYEDVTRSYTTAICSGNEWKFIPLKCEKKNCKELVDPENGRTMYYNNYTYLSVAIQFCNDGFRIKCSGDQREEMNAHCKRICQADGKWSDSTAMCSPILCPELEAPKNGIINGLWNKVNSIKKFVCNEGYQLSGSHIRKCTRDGYWDGTNTTCTVLDCGDPPKIPFAYVSYKITTHGAKAEYECTRGSSLVGQSPTLVCGEVNNKSAWLPKPEPQCMLHCLPFMIDNAKIYPHDQTQSADMILYNKVPHGTQINVKCQAGFEVNINGIPNCNNGSWTYTPKCIEASCANRPPSVKYSTIRFYSLKHNSAARYYCHSGYRIQYTENGITKSATHYDIYCIKGEWGKMPPEGCQPIRCNKPQTPTNGEIYLLGQSDRTKLTDELIKPVHNRVVKYECQTDYRLKGPKIAVCLNGQWSPPESPICEFIMHDELPISWLYYQDHNKK